MRRHAKPSHVQSQILATLFRKSKRKDSARGLSMAEICRKLNRKPILFCGRQKCGFPNPRKRKTMTLFTNVCKPKYSTVMPAIRSLSESGEVTITSEMRYDVIKQALDPRRIVRIKQKERLTI